MSGIHDYLPARNRLTPTHTDTHASLDSLDAPTLALAGSCSQYFRLDPLLTTRSASLRVPFDPLSILIPSELDRPHRTLAPPSIAASAATSCRSSSSHLGTHRLRISSSRLLAAALSFQHRRVQRLRTHASKACNQPIYSLSLAALATSGTNDARFEWQPHIGRRCR